MNGSIAAIITLGFGTWGSPGLVVTLGYGQATAVATTAPPADRTLALSPRGRTFEFLRGRTLIPLAR